MIRFEYISEMAAGQYPPLTTSTFICGTYCDVYGSQQPAKYCLYNNLQKLFCCGSDTFRYCCANATMSNQSLEDDITCSTPSWWYYQYVYTYYLA